jgi:hypothetical protein
MSPTLNVVIFGILGFGLLWSIVNDLRTGKSTTRRMTFNIRKNPAGFYFVVFCKSVFVCLAIVGILNALGLIGNPVIWMRQNWPFLAPS